ncbi:hypothetical protein ACFFIS_17645 [Virgibacillus soli]|uniref:hypothetical protein n=1 Tax=Paracerasibacillus soli TaxID=480284 RepID=UPI0035E8DE38
MQCKNCGNEQNEGKFCGQCGGPLEENVHVTENTPQEEVAATSVESQEVLVTSSTQAGTEANGNNTSNESIEKVKETSKMFGQYFVNYLKHPSEIFSKKGHEFQNGMISLVLLSVIMSLSFYFMVDDMSWSGIPFFSTFASIFVFVAISMILVIAVLFVVNLFFGGQVTFREMVSVYGVHMVPVIVIALLSLLLILLNSYSFGGILLMVSLGFILTTVPLYLIASLLTKQSKSLDAFYGYIVYIVMAGIVFLIYFSIIIDSTIGNLIDGYFYW